MLNIDCISIEIDGTFVLTSCMMSNSAMYTFETSNTEDLRPMKKSNAAEVK